jgi:hypothetical protein
MQHFPAAGRFAGETVPRPLGEGVPDREPSARGFPPEFRMVEIENGVAQARYGRLLARGALRVFVVVEHAEARPEHAAAQHTIDGEKIRLHVAGELGAPGLHASAPLPQRSAEL